MDVISPARSYVGASFFFASETVLASRIKTARDRFITPKLYTSQPAEWRVFLLEEFVSIKTTRQSWLEGLLHRMLIRRLKQRLILFPESVSDASLRSVGISRD